jgi:hypothetical protein
MRPRKNFTFVSLVSSSSLPLALVLLFATPTPTLALGDWIGVEGSLWRQSQDGNASIDGSILPGTTVDFQDTLGLDKNDTSTMGRVWFRFSKTRLVFDYFDSSRSGSETLGQLFFFDGTAYAAGQSLKSDLNLKLLQGQFLFSVANLKVVDVGLGIGVNQAKINMELDNGLPGGKSTLDESIPYPTLAAYVTIKPIPTFHIKVEMNGVRATVSGTHVDIIDSRLQLEWYVAHVLGFFAGYRQFRFDVVDQDFGSVENTFKGPYGGIGLKF